ncbi:GDP-4-dehydro-6-deoxy-D-mannose reductase [Bosea sp. BE125]|uniref:GDP-mannose 4,6-dehydratase n=1 Tax=Bosea sp. BE125 TaxID=2817909 RepID=UPI002861809A|nr:GDP-mannose 4,6-dehydratase [Bosea sp. BE125]MDR6874180.1 GDP-4-dehydro-6-deoxy-D-mannose reductase [Bosea sp. BE125]
MNSRPWRIAVTGAAGFVGSVFLRHVAELDMPGIEAVSIFGSAAGDIRDFGQVSRAIAAMRPDVVLHLAAVAAPSAARADPSEAWHVNVMGTLHIAQAIREQSPKTRLLFVGSSEAYGGSFLTSPSPVAETAALLPRNTYAATKAAADLMIGQMSVDGLNAIRFRPFNHSGPGQTSEYVLPAFAQQVARIEKGQQPPVLNVGNLDAERDFLDVRDVVHAYFQAALPETQIPMGAVFNVATGHPVRIGQILSLLLDQAKVPIDVKQDAAKFRPNDIPRASGDSRVVRESLGWYPTITLEQTVADVLEFFRSRP